MPSEKKRNPFALRHYNMELGKGCTKASAVQRFRGKGSRKARVTSVQDVKGWERQV